MSLQLGILQILASHKDGFASIASLNADIRLLSGADWSRKLRTLSRRAGPVNLFSDGLVAREAGGWRLTEAGWQLVAALDASTADDAAAAAQTAAGLRLIASQDIPRASTARGRLALAKTA